MLDAGERKTDMLNLIKYFEKFIVMALLGLMMFAVFISTIELAFILVQELMKPPFLLLDMKELLEVFGFFMLVLIGLELLETIVAYLEEEALHVEVVFLVAMVAVSRKIVILDYKETQPELLLGIAAIILSLSVGYFCVKRALAIPRDSP